MATKRVLNTVRVRVLRCWQLFAVGGAVDRGCTLGYQNAILAFFANRTAGVILYLHKMGDITLSFDVKR